MSANGRKIVNRDSDCISELDDRYGAIVHTNIGTPAVRPPAPSREQLIWLARAAARLLAAEAPNTAAVCAAFLREIEENARLREQLAEAQGWGSEPTRRQSQQDRSKLIARSTRTGTVCVPKGVQP